MKHLREIPTGSPLWNAKYRWGIKISRFSTNNSSLAISRRRYEIAPSVER